jgi:hypothetical protein
MRTKKIIIDTTVHAEIVRSLSEKLKAYYVFPDIAYVYAYVKKYGWIQKT